MRLREVFTGTRILKDEEELVIINCLGNTLAIGNVILLNCLKIFF